MDTVQTDVVQVALPVEWRERLKTRASERGQTSTIDYIMQLIADDIEPPYLDEKTERLILEGLDSGPAEPIDEKFWEDRRRKLNEYVKAKRS